MTLYVFGMLSMEYLQLCHKEWRLSINSRKLLLHKENQCHKYTHCLFILLTMTTLMPFLEIPSMIFRSEYLWWSSIWVHKILFLGQLLQRRWLATSVCLCFGSELVDQHKIYLSPLNIQLGLVKNVVILIVPKVNSEWVQ